MYRSTNESISHYNFIRHLRYAAGLYTKIDHAKKNQFIQKFFINRVFSLLTIIQMICVIDLSSIRLFKQTDGKFVQKTTTVNMLHSAISK